MRETCCALRRKIVVGIWRFEPEETCGVGDSELLDVTVFDPDGKGQTVHFRYCPWCGVARAKAGETRVTEPPIEGGELC